MYIRYVFISVDNTSFAEFSEQYIIRDVRFATANLISALYHEGSFRKALSIEFYTNAYTRIRTVLNPSFFPKLKKIKQEENKD